MTRHIEGRNRNRSFLLPESVDDYVGEDNPVRVVDAFVDELGPCRDWLRPHHARQHRPPSLTPGHAAQTLPLRLPEPGTIQSAARTRGAAKSRSPVIDRASRAGLRDHRHFRRDNGPAIKATCRQFVALCRTLDLFSDSLVAIDGSKLKAMNSRDKSYSQSVIQRRMEQVDASISRYLAALDTADRHDPGVPSGKVQRLREKLDRLRGQMRDLREMEAFVAASPDGQVSVTDPDARAMTSTGRGTP